MNPEKLFGFISIFNSQSTASDAISSGGECYCKSCYVQPGVGSEPTSSKQPTMPQ